jgi:hypothetical protein
VRDLTPETLQRLGRQSDSSLDDAQDEPAQGSSVESEGQPRVGAVSARGRESLSQSDKQLEEVRASFLKCKRTSARGQSLSIDSESEAGSPMIMDVTISPCSVHEGVTFMHNTFQSRVSETGPALATRHAKQGCLEFVIDLTAIALRPAERNVWKGMHFDKVREYSILFKIFGADTSFPFIMACVEQKRFGAFGVNHFSFFTFCRGEAQPGGALTDTTSESTSVRARQLRRVVKAQTEGLCDDEGLYVDVQSNSWCAVLPSLCGVTTERDPSLVLALLIHDVLVKARSPSRESSLQHTLDSWTSGEARGYSLRGRSLKTLERDILKLAEEVAACRSTSSPNSNPLGSKVTILVDSPVPSVRSYASYLGARIVNQVCLCQRNSTEGESLERFWLASSLLTLGYDL